MTKISATAEVKKPRARLFYLDLVRALAVLIIVLTHFNNPFLSAGHYLIVNEPFGIYIGGVGVSLFLIISGAALTYTYQRPLNLKRFYYKRFIGIYPMFWIAWILATVYFFVDSGGHPLNAAPAKTFIFTFFGVDGMAASMGIPSMYLLGEWFLGFILIFYLVFPVMLWGIDKYPVISALAILCIYGLSFIAFSHLWFPTSILLPVRLPELAFGIYFVKYLNVVKPWMLIPATLILVGSALRPDIHEDLATTLVGISCFVIIVYVARFIEVRPITAIVSLIAAYSYPIFLVHHVVIMKLFMSMDYGKFYPIQLYAMFVSAWVIIMFLSWALVRIEKTVVSFCFQALSIKRAGGSHV